MILLVGRQEGHPACKKFSVGLLMVIWLQLCTSYSSICHHHHQPQLNPELRHSGTGLPGLSCKMAVKQASSSVSCTTSLTDWFKLRQQKTAWVQAHVSPTQLVMLQGPSRCFQPWVILWRGLSRSHRFVTFTELQLSGFTVPKLHIACTYLPSLKDTYHSTSPTSVVPRTIMPATPSQPLPHCSGTATIYSCPCGDDGRHWWGASQSFTVSVPTPSVSSVCRLISIWVYIIATGPPYG